MFAKNAHLDLYKYILVDKYYCNKLICALRFMDQQQAESTILQKKQAENSL